MELVEVKIDQSNFVHVYPQNSLLWSIIRPSILKLLSFREKTPPTSQITFSNSKIKIGVDLSVTYQNQLGEK